jgi:DNA-directed RNA polymerase subunit RPC12/RpoP
MPSCFEFYVYECTKCGGDVTYQHLELHSDQLVEYLHVSSDGTKYYRTVYTCERCHHGGETADDHWSPTRAG